MVWLPGWRPISLWNVLLKKYFWVVNLVVIGVCAAFAGRAAGHIVEGAYLAGDDLQGADAPLGAAAGDQGARQGAATSSSRATSSARGCVPPKPATTTERDGVERAGPSRRCSSSWSRRWCARATTNWSMAVIRDMSTKEKDPEMFHRGSVIGSSGATSVNVSPPSGSTSATPAGSSTSSSTAALRRRWRRTRRRQRQRAALNPRARRHRQGRQLHRQRLHRRPRAGREAAVEHHHAGDRGALRAVDQGRQAQRLQAVRDPPAARSSASIGLQNGDTIKAINGNEMTTPGRGARRSTPSCATPATCRCRSSGAARPSRWTTRSDERTKRRRATERRGPRWSRH